MKYFLKYNSFFTVKLTLMKNEALNVEETLELNESEIVLMQRHSVIAYILSLIDTGKLHINIIFL